MADKEPLHATISAEHIEPANKPFFVRFTRAQFINEYLHPEDEKLIKVMAQTEAGALKVAKYHYARLGEDFALERRLAQEFPGAYPFRQVAFPYQQGQQRTHEPPGMER